MDAKRSTSITALVLCDVQPDVLGSLPNRDALLSSLQIILEIARAKKWMIVYSGLKFQSGMFCAIPVPFFMHLF